jgi:hypothetical protein
MNDLLNPSQDFDAAQNAGVGLFNSGFFIYFLIFIGVIILFFVIFAVLKNYLRKVARFSTAFDKIVLLITVPKESTGDDNKQQKQIKDLLSPMESFFANIGGLKAQKGWRANFLGRNDHISFETVINKDGVIRFYVVMPKYLRQFVEQQIHAQHSAAQVEVVEDYNLFDSKSQIESAYLKLRNKWVFPIKTYQQLENDPLNGILTSLSKISQSDSAAIQIVARSANADWHRVGAKIASEMQQGKKLSEVMNKKKGGAWKFIKSFYATDSKKDQMKDINKTHQLSPMEQEIIKTLEAKSSKAGLDVNVRIIVASHDKNTAKMSLQNILNSFSQYTGYEYGNGFKAVPTSGSANIIRNFIYRDFNSGTGFILNTEELTSLFHFPLSTTEVPNIQWLLAKKAPAPVNIPTEGIILGKNIYRGEEKIIRIKRDDRRRHVYMIGKTGVGKSVLISNMAIQDIENGEGVCVIDPNGDLVENILANVPKGRAEDVIYFNPAKMERPMGLNLLEYDPKYPEQKTFVINEMIKILDKLYDLRQTGGPMFEQYMRNAMLLIMEHPESGSTLMEIPKVLADADFRHFKLKYCQNPVVRDFWTKEAEKAGGEAALSNMTPYITSKLNQFISNDIMRPIIGQQVSAFNFRKAMDEGKIVLVTLPKGLVGDLNAYLLGLVIVGKITMAAFSRADTTEENRRDFYLYIDEFQNFITDTIGTILSEARKYKLDLTIAHQYMGQLIKNNDTSIRDAVLGTVGTMIAFNIGIEDAQVLVKQFAPVLNEYDLINVERFNAYVKLLVDKETVRPFNMLGLPPKKGNEEVASLIREMSQLKYGRPKATIENEILERVKTVELNKKPAMSDFGPASAPRPTL